MRIGLLIYGDMASLSGGYLYNRKLVDHLHRAGHWIDLISLEPRSFVRHLGDNLDSALYARILAASLDVLIVDAMAHPSLWLMNRRLSRHDGITVIALAHLLANHEELPWYRRHVQRFVERRFLNSVDGIVANSQTTWAQIRALMDGRAVPHCVAFPAGDHFSNVLVDAAEIERRALHPGPLKILAVGNVIRRKGFHVLIEALEQWEEREFQVTVVGRLDMEADYVARLRARIRQLGLGDHVALLGPLQGEALARAYAAHHLMALPSRYESFGIVYLEAQQFGLPAIGTTEGAAWEVIRDGHSGFLVKPNDAVGLGTLLQSLHRDRQNLARMGVNALANFRRFALWDESCKVIGDFVRAVRESKSPQFLNPT